MPILACIGRIIRAFFKDDCLNLAANIAFCAILAIIPISMMMISIAGYFLGSSQEAFHSMVGFATDLLPVGRDVFVANLQSVMEQRASLGIAGVVFLVFIATILVASIERSLDVVFKTVARRNFFHSRLLGIAVIFWVTVLFSLPTMAQVLEGLLKHAGFDFPLSELMRGKIYILFISFLSYLMMVVVVPNEKVFVRYALFGSLCFAAGLMVVKFIFLAYMHVALKRYNLIYGSLTAVVLLVVWTYYLSALMLLCAEIVVEMQQRKLFHRTP